MRIVQHCKKSHPNVVTGQLLGMDIADTLEVTARTADGIVMGVRHRTHDVEGVQFHPESILTGCGHDLLRNFLARAA